MKISLEFSYESLNLSEIEEFEKKIKSRLPDDYRNFLSLSNGGKPVKRRFKTKDGKITSSLMLLFPLSEHHETNLIQKYNQYTVSNIVPSYLLPIGVDPFGSLICLSISEESIGHVYFCDMDYFEEDGELRPEYISLISNSFTDFLNSLFLPDEQ